MKYKLYESNYKGNDPVERVLINRGISDCNTYLNLTEENVQGYKCLDNIQKAAELLISHMSNNDVISIIVDEDVDGFCSAAMMLMYINRVYPKCPVRYILHSRAKSHGISNDVDIPKDTKLLIVPDAGTNDIEAQQRLSENMDIIILDHHEPEGKITTSDNVIIVNNQCSPGYKNKDLCGAGIVYRFLQCIDDKLWEEHADDFLDLCALANISDIMDMRSFETRYIVNEGLKNIRSKCFNAFINAQSYSMNGEVNIHNVQWYITPIMNGMIRIGDITEKELLFRAFIETDEEFDYKKRGATEPIKESIYDRAARLCKNAKSRQDKLRDKGTKFCDRYINNEDNKVIIIDGTMGIDRRLSGVIAIRVAEKYHKPCIIISKHQDKEDIYGGSARNFDHSPIESFKDIVSNNKFFNFARGHGNAFGVEIKANNIMEAQKAFNEMLRDVEYDNTYYCDFILQNKADIQLIYQLCSMKNLFGQCVDEPIIAVEHITLNGTDFQVIGKNNDTITFEIDGIKYIKFRCDYDDDINLFLSDAGSNPNAEVEFTIIGKPSENIYNGNKTLQIIISDWEVTGTNILGDEDDEW